MALADLKINDSDFAGKGVSDLPTKPGETKPGWTGLTEAALKQWFDNEAETIVKEHFNSLIDELASTNGAADIGEGGGAGNVQNALDNMKSHLGDKHNPHEDNGDNIPAVNAAGEPATVQGALDEKLPKSAVTGVLQRNDETVPTGEAVGVYVDEKIIEIGAADMRKSDYVTGDPDNPEKVDGALYAEEAAHAGSADEAAHAGSADNAKPAYEQYVTNQGMVDVTGNTTNFQGSMYANVISYDKIAEVHVTGVISKNAAPSTSQFAGFNVKLIVDNCPILKGKMGNPSVIALANIMVGQCQVTGSSGARITAAGTLGLGQVAARTTGVNTQIMMPGRVYLAGQDYVAGGAWPTSNASCTVGNIWDMVFWIVW